MAMVGLLNPGRKTKSMTLRMFSSTWVGRSRMKLGEYGTSLFQSISEKRMKRTSLLNVLELGLVLLHHIKLGLSLVEGDDGNCMLGKR